MNLAQPFKAGIHKLIRNLVASATIESRVQLVADATELFLVIGYRGLKATAKVMPTLRVEKTSQAKIPTSAAVC